MRSVFRLHRGSVDGRASPWVSALLVVLVAASCVEDVDEVSRSSATEAALPSASAAASAASGTGAPSDWDAVPLVELEEPELGPGEFRTAGFVTPFRFSLPDGWVALVDDVDLVAFVPDGFGIDTGVVWFVDIDESTIDAALARVGAVPDVLLGEQEPAVVGGAVGIAYDVSVPTTQLLTTLDSEYLDFWVEDRFAYTFTTVDVAGAIVTVVVEGEASTFDLLEQEAGLLLDSVVWKELS